VALHIYVIILYVTQSRDSSVGIALGYGTRDSLPGE